MPVKPPARCPGTETGECNNGDIRRDAYDHVADLLEEVQEFAAKDDVSVRVDARDLVTRPSPPWELSEQCCDTDDVMVGRSSDQCRRESDGGSASEPIPGERAPRLPAWRRFLRACFVYREEPGTHLALRVGCCRPIVGDVIALMRYVVELCAVAHALQNPWPRKSEPFRKVLVEPPARSLPLVGPCTIKLSPRLRYGPRAGTIQHLRRRLGDKGVASDTYNLAWPSQRLPVTLPDNTTVHQELEVSADLEVTFDPLSMELTVSVLALHMSVHGQLEGRVRHGAVLGYFVDWVRIEAVAGDPALLVLQTVSPLAATADIPVHQERECGKERQRGIGLNGAASPSVSITAGRVTNARQLEEADATRRPWVWTSAKTNEGTTAVWTWAMSAWEGGFFYSKTDALPAGDPLPRLDRRLAGAASVLGTAERVAARWSVHPSRAGSAQAPVSSPGGWPSTVRLALRMDAAVSAVVERDWSRHRVNPFAQRPELRSWPARKGNPEAAVSFNLELRLPPRRP